MLIKEYRIPMPMSVEEYRIAQLYMIQVRRHRRAPPLLAQTRVAVPEALTLGKSGCGVTDGEVKGLVTQHLMSAHIQRACVWDDQPMRIRECFSRLTSSLCFYSCGGGRQTDAAVVRKRLSGFCSSESFICLTKRFAKGRACLGLKEQNR